MSDIERLSQLPVKFGKNTEGTPLPQLEIREVPFYLIKDFKATLRHAKDFQDALAQHYIGELDYGYQVKPENNRKVDFWRGDVCWGITYTFTEDQQELIIERQLDSKTDSPIHETITLQSQRFDEQSPTGIISYFKQVPSRSGEPMSITTHKNDIPAVRNTHQVLQDFQAGR